MAPDVNAQPSSRFEEPPRRVPVREMRGYAPRKVDEQLRQLTAELREAHQRIAELEQAARRSASGARVEQLLQAAREQAAEYVRAVSAEAEEIRSAAEAYAAEQRAAVDREIAGLRASAELEASSVRSKAEREAAVLKAAAVRERDEVVTAAKREAGDIRRREQFLLEQSEAIRSQAEADLEVDIAARREEIERAEVERLADAHAATRTLVTEAERRAADAEKRAAAAIAQAEATRRGGELDAQALTDEAVDKAAQIVGKARAQADEVLAGIDAAADERRAERQRELDELTRQKNEVADVIAQMRKVFMAPAVDGALGSGGDTSAA